LAATARPVLTDLTVRGSALRELAPARPADVFAGLPLLLTAALNPAGGEVEITGRLAGTDDAWRPRFTVPAAAAVASKTALPIGALFGREIIADLEQELAAGNNIEHTSSLIEMRGLRHRITSRRTSLVAIAERPAVDPTQPR